MQLVYDIVEAARNYARRTLQDDGGAADVEATVYARDESLNQALRLDVALRQALGKPLQRRLQQNVRETDYYVRHQSAEFQHALQDRTNDIDGAPFSFAVLAAKMVREIELPDEQDGGAALAQRLNALPGCAVESYDLLGVKRRLAADIVVDSYVEEIDSARVNSLVLQLVLTRAYVQGYTPNVPPVLGLFAGATTLFGGSAGVIEQSEEERAAARIQALVPRASRHTLGSLLFEDSPLRARLGLPSVSEVEQLKEHDLQFTLGPCALRDAAPRALVLHNVLTNVVHQLATTLAVLQEHCQFAWMSERPLDELELVDLYEEPQAAYGTKGGDEITNKHFLRYRALRPNERYDSSTNELVTSTPVELRGKQGFVVDQGGALVYALRDSQLLHELPPEVLQDTGPSTAERPVLIEYQEYGTPRHSYEESTSTVYEGDRPIAVLDAQRSRILVPAGVERAFVAFVWRPIDAYTLRPQLNVAEPDTVRQAFTETRARVTYDAKRRALVELLPFQYRLRGGLVEVPNLGFLVRLRHFERTTAFFDFTQFMVTDQEAEVPHALKVHFARIGDPWYPFGKPPTEDGATRSFSGSGVQLVTEQIHDLLPGVASYGDYKRFVANYQNLYSPAVDLAILFNTLIREKRLMLYKHAAVRAYIEAEAQAHLTQYGNLQRFQVHVVDDIIPVSVIAAGLKTLPPLAAALVNQSAALLALLRTRFGARAKEILNEVARRMEQLKQLAPVRPEDVLALLQEVGGEELQAPDRKTVATLLGRLLEQVEVPPDYVQSQNFMFPQKTLAGARDLLRQQLFRWDPMGRTYDAYNGLLDEETAQACDSYRPTLRTLLQVNRQPRPRDYADLTILERSKLGTERLVQAIERNGAELRNLYDTSRLATSNEAMVQLLSSLNRQSDAFIAQGSQGFIHRVTIELRQEPQAQVEAEYRREVTRCESARAQARNAPLSDVSQRAAEKVARLRDDFAVGQLPQEGATSQPTRDVNQLVADIVRDLYGKTPAQVVQEQQQRPDQAQIRQIVDALRQQLQQQLDKRQVTASDEEATLPTSGIQSRFTPLRADPPTTTPSTTTLKVRAAIKSFKSGLPPGNPADYITISENNIQSPELVNETMISAIVSTLYERGLSPNFMWTYAVFMAKYTPRSLVLDTVSAVTPGAVSQFFAAVIGQDPLLKQLLDGLGLALGGQDAGGDFSRLTDVDVPAELRRLIESRDLPALGLQFFVQLRKLAAAFGTRALNEALLRGKIEGLLALLDNYAQQGLLKGDLHMESHVQQVRERLRLPLRTDDEADTLDTIFYLAMALNLVAAVDPDAANLLFLDLKELTLLAPPDYLQLYHSLSIGDRLDRTFERWARGELLLSGKLGYQDHLRAVAALVHSPAVEAATRNEIYLIQELIQGSFSKFRRFCSKLQLALMKEKKPVPTFDQYVTNALQQVTYSLQLFQDYFNGVHGDLHPDNIFVKYCDETLYKGVPLHLHEQFEYTLRGRTYSVKNMGFIVKLGDMGHSSINVGITGKPYVQYDATLQRLVTDQIQNRKQIHKEIKLGTRELSLRLVNEQLQTLLQVLPELLQNNLDSVEKIVQFLQRQDLVPSYFTGRARGIEGELARRLIGVAKLVNSVSPKTMLSFLQSVQAFGLAQARKVDLLRLLSNLAAQLQLITKMRSVNRFLPAFDMSNCFQNLSYDAEFYQTPMVSLFCALEVALETARFGTPKNFERSLPNMYPLVVVKAINMVQFNDYLSRGFTFLTTPEQMVRSMHNPRRLRDLAQLKRELEQGEQFALKLQSGGALRGLGYALQQRNGPLSCKVCRSRGHAQVRYDATVGKLFCSAACRTVFHEAK